MKKCKITVIRIACYKDLMERYENPITDACNMKEGQIFIANGWKKPDGFCDSAWESISPFVMTLSYGGEDIYCGWMKNKKSAMISCNDGFRPVSFLIEAMEEEAY
ncbi:MAG: TIGR04076 family protein [Lachnospiraceae bacterium]|nr:TIGR04076 family protein [Lachnospiraceae bacterium]